MFVVRVQVMFKVEELKLRIFGLLSLDHDLHLTTMLTDEFGRLLDNCVKSVTSRLRNRAMKENQFPSLWLVL